MEVRTLDDSFLKFFDTCFVNCHNVSHKIIWSRKKKTYLHANYFFWRVEAQLFFKMSALKYYLKFIEKHQRLCVLLRKVNAYSPGQNILQRENQANMGKTRKPWYLLLQKFWLLLPKTDLVYVLSLFMSYYDLVIWILVINNIETLKISSRHTSGPSYQWNYWKG